MAEVTLASLLADVTTILTSMVSWTGSVISMVTSNPLLEIFVLGTFGLIAIGIVKRLIRL